MELDNIWQLPEDSIEHPVITGGRVYIAGGMLSGPGGGQCTSFRGKVYAEFIEALSGHSLYSDELDQEAIEEIAGALEEFQAEYNLLEGRARYEFLKNLFSDSVSAYRIETCLETLEHLTIMFRKYSEMEGVTLTSWY